MKCSSGQWWAGQRKRWAGRNDELAVAGVGRDMGVKAVKWDKTGGIVGRSRGGVVGNVIVNENELQLLSGWARGRRHLVRLGERRHAVGFAI
jgi:hypothetical protein